MFFGFEEGEEPILFGDIHFLFKNRGMMTDSLICRIAFNTAFVGLRNTYNFDKTIVSPDKIKKDSRISDEFFV
jgi:hypothetical protein